MPLFFVPGKFPGLRGFHEVQFVVVVVGHGCVAVTGGLLLGTGAVGDAAVFQAVQGKDLLPTPAPAGMPDLGVVRAGKLVEEEDVDGTWRGMVTAARIDAQRNGRALGVRQHLTSERQLQ